MVYNRSGDNMKKIIFVIIELLLLIMANLFDNVEKEFKFLAINLCFLYAMTFPGNKLLKISFLLTNIADLFLFVRDDHYEVGVFLFILVQFIYFLHLGVIKLPHYEKTLIIILLLLGFIYNELIYLVLIYGVFSLVNVIFGIVNIKKNPLFILGITFLLICDIFVGLNNLGVQNASQVAWYFYIPSQGLIALSIDKKSICVL